MATYSSVDIIKTIEENDSVPDFSEESSEEDEFQPKKSKITTGKEFDSGFHFVTSNADYNRDHWNDVTKYIKRKATHKTDDKIAAFKRKADTDLNNLNGNNEGNADDDSHESSEEYYLSDEDLEKDNIKIKSKKIKSEPNNEYEFSESINENSDITSFYQMNLSRPLMKSITEMNFVHPTPIQSATIPVALLGRDICGCAATGTGKTAAYMLPILERLLYRPTGSLAVTRVLILVPTRELGVQVYQVSKELAQYTSVEIGLSVGGLDLKTQEANLRRQPDIVIATPGRLIDHIKNTPGFSLDSIEVLVLDEADRMLDEYFAEQMKEIVKQCARTRQTLLFSATMTTAVKDLANVSLVNPVKIFVDNNQDVTMNLRQEFIRIRKDKESDREAVLAALVCRTFRSNCIVFVRTKSMAHRLHILLGLLNVKVAELHGNLRQPQRLDALKRFKDGVVDVLVATDVAARGLDIVGVISVINYELPPTLEHYIHRVGRTARAGRSGVSVSLAGELDRKLVKTIVKSAKRPVKSRIIPLNILEKYKKKVTSIKGAIEDILKEEMQERLMEKAEKQLTKAERKLKSSGTEPAREWFQTKKQRKDEKDSLKEKSTMSKKKSDGKSKKKSKKDKFLDDDERKEINKKVLSQVRVIKKKQKMSKIRQVADIEFNNSSDKKFQNSKNKKKGSSFDKDFTNYKNQNSKNKFVKKNPKNSKSFFGKKK